MGKTLDQITAEQTAAKTEADAQQRQRQVEREAEAAYQTAWNQFIRACYLECSDKAAGQAIEELASLIVERGRLPRLQEVVEAFSDRPYEAYAAAALLATGAKASPSKRGKSFNAAKTWANPGALSDAADTLRGSGQGGSVRTTTATRTQTGAQTGRASTSRRPRAA